VPSPSRHRAGLALALAALALSGTAALAAPPHRGHGDPHPRPHLPAYLLGAAVADLSPTPQEIAAGDFYLGGYGLSSGKALNQVPVIDGRAATGVLRDPAFPNGLADGVHVRAVVIGAGHQAIALAQVETQGMFAAYKQGPFGLVDIRRDAAAAVAALHGPAMGAGAILVDSNHSHAGPDTAGVWGGVPTAYLKRLHDRTVAAIVAAYRAMRPVDLYYGTAHAGVSGEAAYPSSDPLLTNQFSADPANQVVDDEVRVLQARDARGRVVATYVNFSAHPTVLGGDNTLASADYTGPLSAMLSALGGTGMAQVGTLGRTQPARTGCPDHRLTGAAADVCSLNTYAGRVFQRVRQALTRAVPVRGTPQVALHSYLLTDPATNGPIVALTYGGLAVGAPIYRAANPPWMSGDVLGSASFSGRIGDLLLSGSPGEAYPQIAQAVAAAVPAQGHLHVGTAGDFLGYIVAPVTAYPEPVRRSMLDGGPPPSGSADCSGGASPVALPSPVGCPDPISNDNYFFNASETLGERLTCSLLRGAGEVMAGDPSRWWRTDSVCPAFAQDYLLPADRDTTFPAQPDLSGLPGFSH
jgi:hypothetical protein